MKKYSLLLLILFAAIFSTAQNVGIGTATPGFPLNFSNALGDKISLYGNTGNHYGFGIQGGLLQMYSDAAAANISFGYGSSAAFTERMRIINNGGDGLLLNGRITLRNGTSPVDPNYGSGVWLYNPDNTALLGFIGVQNSQNIGFYGGPLNNGWGFTYDAINSRVGIGTSTPTASLMLTTSVNPQLHIRQTNIGDYSRIRMQTGTNRYWDIAGYNDATTIANERLNFFNSQAGDILSLTGNGYVGIGTTNPITPLGFPASLGRKITLYPGGTGVVGMGVYSNEFRIHTDYQPADITFGFENNAGAFTERFRFKGNGALAINGNTGLGGQVLTSTGNASPPTWNDPKVPVVYSYNQSSNTGFAGTTLEFEISGLIGSFTLGTTSTVVFTGNMNILNGSPILTGFGYTEIRIYDASSNVVASARNTGAMDPLRKSTLNPVGSVVLGPGFYTVKGFMGRLIPADLSNVSFSEIPGQIIVQVFPN